MTGKAERRIAINVTPKLGEALDAWAGEIGCSVPQLIIEVVGSEIHFRRDMKERKTCEKLALVMGRIVRLVDQVRPQDDTA